MSEAEDQNQNAGARKKTENKPSLAEVMQKGTEEKKKQGDERDASHAVGGTEDHKEDIHSEDSETDEEEYNMMIAGLSEVALLMKKPEPVFGTGFLYDEKFTLHKNDWQSNFPEKPARVTSPYKRCCDLDLVNRCTRIEVQYGTEDQVLLQHSQRQIDILQSVTEMDINERKSLSTKYDSVYFHQETFQTAMLAMGSTVEMMEQILKKNVRNGFVLARPPGHHAVTEEFCGFSFFNNVAIAAKHAVDNLGLKRVLIVDWDVHHGQATQQMFYNDPRVLYFSIHRYEYGDYWPKLRESDYDFIGDGEGKGFNINVPLNQTGIGDSDYLAILQQILMPVAYQYNPELVLISSGYDAAVGCPEGEMMVTPAAYAHFIHMLSSLAEGRVCAVLEGGYNIKSLSEGVALSVRSLLGDPCPMLKPTTEPSDSVTESILNVIKCLSPYWTCLCYQSRLDEDEPCEFDGVNSDPPKDGIVFDTPENKPSEYPLTYTYPYNVEQEYIQAESKWNSTIDSLIAETSLTVPPHRTCLVYDKGMKAHRAIGNPGHPEKPERISRIYDKHRDWGLLERCLQLKCRLAEPEELELVHSEKFIDQMKKTETFTPEEMSDFQEAFTIPGEKVPVFVNNDSYICARMAAGCTLNVIDCVLSGQARNGVAIVRPPGHHAECEKPMGFCFFNSVAIAAKYAQKKFGVKKVLLLDWDVHHGNGTQHMFYEDPSVLYISLHRYDGGFFYPSSTDGNYNMVGRKASLGFNVNIPWHYGGKGDAEYLAAFQQIVMPIAYEYAPDLVLVSAGFDAAIGDPLGGCKVTPAGYGHMTHMLSGLASGRVIVVLEGGYNLVSMANSMATCTSVLLGDPAPVWRYEQPQQIAVMTICDVLDTHRSYWKSLKFRVGIPVKEKEESSTNEEENKTDEDISKLSDQLSSVSVREPNTDFETKQSEESMAEQGSSNGAEGGSDKFSSNKELLKHYEDQGVEAMYAVEPLKDCKHLDEVAPLPEGGLNVNDPCEECEAKGENWVCLVCYKVYCSRYVKEHMVKHGKEAKHPVVLSYADLSVWCYECDNYLDNEKLKPAKQSAHKSKFGRDL
ncbi:histone deacetylase 6-like isoform X1 [Mercenaria mercenaria]|uniref:histone deacetylase 6-like isoform X1 n=2 Tax=Mercenaria mercenaria TaxID=6596 RepID=UPI00234FAB74|nr:histone deacetylase 6-like isoform X1 [Mercenaria mercenaria]XP_045164143.2 histone deacetylase 6-like isoform X1 [Mercenaria mercenaria]